jgi:hypothetical protein
MQADALAYRLRIAIQRGVSNADYWRSADDALREVSGTAEQMGELDYLRARGAQLVDGSL